MQLSERSMHLKLRIMLSLFAQVAKRLESTSRYFKSLGSLGFWGQLVCTVVAAVILSFSVLSKRKITSPTTLYVTAGAIAAAFVSVFWSFGYIRLSDKLRRTANDPSKVNFNSICVLGMKKLACFLLLVSQFNLHYKIGKPVHFRGSCKYTEFGFSFLCCLFGLIIKNKSSVFISFFTSLLLIQFMRG